MSKASKAEEIIRRAQALADGAPENYYQDGDDFVRFLDDLVDVLKGARA